MGKDPSMPFYVNDYLSSAKVACMTLEQQGAFVRLLCHCWASQDASLPDDDEELAALSGMGERWLNGGSRFVRRAFIEHPEKPGHLTSEKLFTLWKERQEWREKSAAGGRKSGKARRLQSSKGGSTKPRTKSEPKANSSSSSSSSSSLDIPPTEESPISSPKEPKPMDCPPLGEFPESVRTEKCRAAWFGWLAYKQKIREPYKTARGHRDQLAAAAQDGEQAFCGTLRNAQRHEWKGPQLKLYRQMLATGDITPEGEAARGSPSRPSSLFGKDPEDPRGNKATLARVLEKLADE